MSSSEIENTLKEETVGRIGMSSQGRTYVMPVNFVYHNNAIYGYTTEGTKTDIMRHNPKVCFEVDHSESLDHWKSVMAWGNYEELQGEEAENAIILLLRRLSPTLNLAELPATQRLTSFGPVIYRIRIMEATGRIEDQQKAA
jgi:hypothetical protein